MAEPDASKLADQAKKKFEIALDLRKYEIDKFWSRAGFFWAFVVAIAGAFGFTISEGSPSAFSILLACIGFLVSLCWSLAARGSKRWQESWESYAGDLEKTLLDSKMLSVVHHNERNESLNFKSPSWFFGPARFSVSRLAIAVADIVTLGWVIVAILVIPIWRLHQTAFAVTSVIATFLLAGFVMWAARSTARSPISPAPPSDS